MIFLHGELEKLSWKWILGQAGLRRRVGRKEYDDLKIAENSIAYKTRSCLKRVFIIMKHAFIFLLLIFLQDVCSAQFDNANKKDSIKVPQAKYQYYNLTTNRDHPDILLPYDSIEFRDVRYDTTFIMMAFPLLHVSRTYNVKVNLDGGLAQNVTRYFNNYYSTVNNNGQKAAVCYIKKFSVTLQHELLEHFFNTGNLPDDTANQVDIEVECYYKKGDRFFPAVRFDTSYRHHFPDIILNASRQIKTLLQPLMSKIEQVNLEHVEKRNAYSEEDISKRYADRFNFPILKTAVYKKGVYKSFNEFRNNAPSIDSFTISTDKMKVNEGNNLLIDPESLAWKGFQTKNTAVFLYDENNNLISPSGIFGYCDGKTIWIQHGAFFYPLVKTGNSFEFMYIYHYADHNLRTNTLFLLTPLNMETGHSN